MNEPLLECWWEGNAPVESPAEVAIVAHMVARFPWQDVSAPLILDAFGGLT